MNKSHTTKTETANIFLVDDEPSMLKIFTELLNFQSGQDGHPIYKITTAINGVECLDIINSSEQEFDILITNIKMAKMDGITLLENLVLLKPQLPVIIVSGYASKETLKKAIQIGAFATFSKPPNLEKFLTSIKEAFEKKISKHYY